MLTTFAFGMMLVMLASNLVYFKLLVSPFRTRYTLIQGRLRQWLLSMVVHVAAGVLGWLADPVMLRRCAESPSPLAPGGLTPT